MKKQTLIRYILYQLPGLLLVVTAATTLKVLDIIPLWLALTILPLWITKDALLFPLTWRAYERQDDGHPMTGREGVTESVLNPAGWGRFGQERWQITKEDGQEDIPAGVRVRVTGGGGLTLTVRREKEG